jgi:hypothetical protein
VGRRRVWERRQKWRTHSRAKIVFTVRQLGGEGRAGSRKEEGWLAKSNQEEGWIGVEEEALFFAKTVNSCHRPTL